MKCSKCGAEISGNTKFCTKCGAEQTEEMGGSGVPAKNRKNSNIGIKIVIIILAVIAVLAILVICMSPFMTVSTF